MRFKQNYIVRSYWSNRALRNKVDERFVENDDMMLANTYTTDRINDLLCIVREKLNPIANIQRIVIDMIGE